MDKKNTIIGVLLLVVAFFLMVKTPKPTPPAPAQPAAVAPQSADNNSAPTPPSASALAPTPALQSPANPSAPADYFTVENDFVKVRFTNAGGAIDQIELKQHAAHLHDGEKSEERYILNAAHAAPALSLEDFPGLDPSARYELASHTDREVVYRAIVPGQLEVTRRYTLLGDGTGDPYQVRHETTFRNLTANPLALPRGAINLGTAAPMDGQDYGMYINASYYNDDGFDHVERKSLEGGGFLSSFGIGSKTDLPYIDKTAPMFWAAVKNQFFTSLLSFDEPASGLRIKRVKTDLTAPIEDRRAYGVTATAYFHLPALPANGSTTWGATYYAGPKEYKRLSNSANFKHAEDKVMNFAPYFFSKIFLSGLFAPLLLTLMTWVHSWLPSWGWAIVVMTLILKFVTLPFTLAASRSAKRMQKLMPFMTEIREKHKDNPQKMQMAMMQLYKEHKVNPLGGCLPILITMPLFVAFFSMLQSASELRFAGFLWTNDLAAPDTVAHIFGFPLNIMPLLMGATMIFQMRLTPTPTTDSAQQTMMKIMPWIFTLFCYNFSCALALYSTVNGLFTIVQQVIVNRLPEPQLATVGSDGLKNVTPKKKK